MAPRGRQKRKLHSESGTSVGGDSEDVDDAASTTSTSTSSRPRRSRVPKRYLDEDYSPPPPTKRRAVGNRDTPSDAGGDEEEELKLSARVQPTPKAAPTTTPAAATRRSKARGRPKKNPTPPRRKSQKQAARQEEDVIYMDEESEEEESSDDEYILHDDPQQEDLDDIDEELNLSDIKPNVEEETYCPWIEDPATLPKLELPETSQDIPIPIHATMDAIEIYEILRSYHRTLRITPFTFEDFCAALISHNNSCIMAEVHMALLKVCLKSDDEEQTQYSVTETNNSVNIMFHHMDTLTYAEILRQYIEAYPFSDSSVRDAINVENYPYVGYESKIVVLLFMSYRFLYSSEFKKVVNNVGRFLNDDNCRVCGKSSGRVVGCTQCEAAYHVECSHLKPFPEVLVCNICKKNNVRGVLPPDESPEKEPLRSQPIGRDRYGRLYWFICRRIIVQSLDETEIHYYSTPPQLYQLLQKLDRTYYEKELCNAIHQRIDEFLEQMTLTVEMTSERREMAIESVMKKNSLSYEFAESTIATIYLNKDSMKRMAAILNECSQKVVKNEPESEPEDEEATRSSGPLEASPKFEEDSILPESMLGIFNGCLINTFWSGGVSQEELVQSCLDDKQPIDPLTLWRMGDNGNDQAFMQYYNYYMRNDMSESFLARKKAADKKKYMASKFSTIDQFEWVVAKDRQFYGNTVLHNKFVGWTLSRIARRIPTDLMHRKWVDSAKGFDLEISVADDYKKLAECLLQLDAVARKTIFMQQWWSGLGQTKLERITADQRETFMKEQQKIKKLEADALAKDLDDSFIRVNYRNPKWPNTYLLRQRGETYRNAGKGVMGGWAWVASKYYEKWLPVPEAPTLPLTSNTKMTESVSNRKACRLNSLVNRITKKRDSRARGSQISTFDLTAKCYSPSCRNSKYNTPNPRCYSSICRSGYLTEAKQRHEEQEQEKRQVLGEEKPWPIPEVQTFSTKRGGKSIFVLQKKILRQMIITAGCQQVYMPGFSAGIKSNLLIWPYPAPRPTLDLCWKWQTLNSRSLHSVALQLKIMWSSIKWNEFEPDDTHPDRRVVIDTPTHDERRRIIRHKEMPPYGQYERYELEIEIIPLYDEQEEEDESWLSKNRATDCSQRTSSNRKKRPQRNLEHRQATAIRKEWVDGVTLKVYEIKDYWKWVRTEAEKAARRKLEAAKKVAKAKEDAEKQRLMLLQRSAATSRMAAATSTGERVTVPYAGPLNRRSGGSSLLDNGIGRLSVNISSHAPLRTPSSYGTSSYAQTSTPSSQLPSTSNHRVQSNPIMRRVPVSSLNPYSQQQYSQQQRAAAGSDHRLNGTPAGSYRSMMTPQTCIPSPAGSMSRSGRVVQSYQARQVTNGNRYQEGPLRNGGVPRTAIIHQPTNPQRRMVVTQQHVQQPAVGEETFGASNGNNDDLPPQIPRYSPAPTDPSIQQRPTTTRQVYSGQVMRSGAGVGTKGNVIYLKGADGGTQKMMVRSGGDSLPGPSTSMYPSGTVINSNGQRLVPTLRPGGQGQQQARQLLSQTMVQQRYPRYPSSGTPRPTEQQFMRRVVQPGQHRQMEYPAEPSLPPQIPHVPQNPRFVIQGRPAPPPKIPRVPATNVPRGGMTMQMVVQQQDEQLLQDDHLGNDQIILHEEVIYNPAEHEEEATGFAVAEHHNEQQ